MTLNARLAGSAIAVARARNSLAAGQWSSASQEQIVGA
jgi:hypothetical protein